MDSFTVVALKVYISVYVFFIKVNFSKKKNKHKKCLYAILHCTIVDIGYAIMIFLHVLRQIIVKVRNTLFKGSANKRQITIVTNLFII